MSHIFFSKNRANTKTHPPADIYASRILEEMNDNDSLPALLIGTSTLQILIPLATSTECLT